MLVSRETQYREQDPGKLSVLCIRSDDNDLIEYMETDPGIVSYVFVRSLFFIMLIAV